MKWALAILVIINLALGVIVFQKVILQPNELPNQAVTDSAVSKTQKAQVVIEKNDLSKKVSICNEAFPAPFTESTPSMSNFAPILVYNETNFSICKVLTIKKAAMGETDKIYDNYKNAALNYVQTHGLIDSISFDPQRENNQIEQQILYVTARGGSFLSVLRSKIVEEKNFTGQTKSIAIFELAFYEKL